MPDRALLKQEAKGILRGARVSPYLFTLVVLVISFVIGRVSDYVQWDTATRAAYEARLGIDLSFLPFCHAPFPGAVTLFVAILCSLLSVILSAGVILYHLGIRRGEHMPYESLFDAFSFAGKAILLSIVESIFIGLWSLLFVVPGIIAAYRYSFAMMDLCENPDLGVMEALDLSKQQTYGYKGQLFMLSLSFFGWLLLAGVAVMAVESILFGGVDNILSLETAASLSQAVSSTFLQQLFASLASVVLTPYIRLSFCGFYLRVTQGDAPQQPQLPEGDPWDNDF